MQIATHMHYTFLMRCRFYPWPESDRQLINILPVLNGLFARDANAPAFASL